MPLLTRDTFLAAAPALKQQEIDIPALGGSVVVHELNAGERDAFEDQHVRSGRKNFRARLAAWTIRDGDRARLFADTDIAALARMPAHVLEPIAEAAVKLNALGAKEVEELEGN